MKVITRMTSDFVLMSTDMQSEFKNKDRQHITTSSYYIYKQTSEIYKHKHKSIIKYLAKRVKQPRVSLEPTMVIR